MVEAGSAVNPVLRVTTNAHGGQNGPQAPPRHYDGGIEELVSAIPYDEQTAYKSAPPVASVLHGVIDKPRNSLESNDNDLKQIATRFA